MSRWRLLDRSEPTLGEADPAPVGADSALAIVDGSLSAFACRTLVSGGEVVDCLPDLRNALVAATLLRQLEERDVALR